jgi:hypothetical protein
MEFIKKALERTAEKNRAEHNKWTDSSQFIEDIKMIRINEIIIPAALANPQGAPQVTPTRINVECHWCAELILDKTKSCKHCGKNNVSILKGIGEILSRLGCFRAPQHLRYV